MNNKKDRGRSARGALPAGLFRAAGPAPIHFQDMPGSRTCRTGIGRISCSLSIRQTGAPWVRTTENYPDEVRKPRIPEW